MPQQFHCVCLLLVYLIIVSIFSKRKGYGVWQKVEQIHGMKIPKQFAMVQYMPEHNSSYLVVQETRREKNN